jgi:hypothetical protein
MKRLNRKEKIKKIQDLATGVNPKSKAQREIAFIKTLSVDGLYAVLGIKELSKQELEEITQGRELDTQEKWRDFLNSEELRDFLRSKKKDMTFLLPCEGCDPIIDTDENGTRITEPNKITYVHENGTVHIAEFKDYSGKSKEECDAIKAPLQEAQPEVKEEPQREEIKESEAIEKQPASIKLIKDNREQEKKIFNLLGEVIEQDKERAKRMDEFRRRYNQLN